MNKRLASIKAFNTLLYGYPSARLARVRVIVEHWTQSEDLQAAIDYWSQSPDQPCTHFLIDKDGSIIQVMRLRYSCRHTLGLNPWSVGIEHVGTSDREVMSNARQLRSSLRLTCWLKWNYRVRRSDVIGHNESLSSPWYRMNVVALRGSTHPDMKKATMDVYRRLLRSSCQF